eukprot:3559665-Karenia_brevis.AAC.1
MDQVSVPDSNTEYVQREDSQLLNETLDLSGETIYPINMVAEPGSRSNQGLIRMVSLVVKSLLPQLQPLQTVDRRNVESRIMESTSDTGNTKLVLDE